MSFSKNHSKTDASTLLQLDHVRMDASERDKSTDYLRKIQGVVNFWWDTVVGHH